MVLSQSRIVRIEWNPKIIDRASKIKPVVPVLSQISPVHAIRSFFLNIVNFTEYEITEKPGRFKYR
jgi:hypothetical protein